MEVQRPDRTTKAGMLWNAEKILDRFDRIHLATLGSEHSKKNAADDDLVDQGKTETFQKLPVPLTEYILGVILFHVVLPPDSDYVGRVGTGLAYKRNHVSSDREHSATTTWSDPKPCSLTALVSPIEDRSAKTVLELIFFVCQPPNTVKGQSDSYSWWDEISHPMGLLVAEEIPPPSSKMTKAKDHDEEEGEEEGQDEKLGHKSRNSSLHHPLGHKRSTWTAVNLTSKSFAQLYPVSPRASSVVRADQTGPCLYYYAWQSSELLKANKVSLSRIMLMEMTTLAGNETTDENQICARLDKLLSTTKETIVNPEESVTTSLDMVDSSLPGDMHIPMAQAEATPGRAEAGSDGKNEDAASEVQAVDTQDLADHATDRVDVGLHQIEPFLDKLTVEKESSGELAPTLPTPTDRIEQMADSVESLTVPSDEKG